MSFVYRQTLGIYGGSFDPVHLGHVGLAQAALGYGIHRLIVIPCRRSPHKRPEDGKEIPTSAEHRWVMLQRAFAHMPKIELSCFELDGPEYSYTWQTLEHFQKTCPQGTRLVLVCGFDSWLSLPHWARFEEWKDSVDYLVFPRKGQVVQAEPESLKNLSVTFAKEELPEVSSTELRQALKDARSHPLLPTLVLDYIREHQLYGIKG